MSYNPNNPNGSATSANSSPVVIASDQAAVPITDNGSSLTVDGSVTVSGTVTANAGTGTQNVSVQNASIPVTDNGGSLTVDGTVEIGATSLAALESVTVQNGSGGSAVNIQDGGNSITVDGSVSVSNFPATQPVSGTVTVQDGGGSVTVDGSVSVSNFPATQAVSATDLDIRNLTSTDVVTVTGGAGQTADVKVTLDSEQVAVSNFPATQAVSGTVTIQDGGNTITVDGTVAATQSGVWDTRTQDGVGNDITSHSAGASRGIDVSIIDGSGNQITSFGGGTQYAEGSVVATPTGTPALMKDAANELNTLVGSAADGLLVNLGANNDITFPYGTIDTFGKLMTSHSRNDVDCQFYRDEPGNILTVTTAGGGTATGSNGYAVFSTSTGTTGSVKGVSLDKTHYHSGGEIYSMFGVAWLDGGQATSFQRIGLFDNNNGFYVGFENTTFGVSVRDGASDTFVGRTSFNTDLLDGSAGSKFTRGGSPEAIDFTKLNVFRIRFGWLGAAAVKYEVLSPDDQWVLFHIIRQPNSSATPHIQSADLPMTLEVTKTAGATDITVNTTCWGAGIQYDNMDWQESSTLSATAGSIIDYNISGLGSASVYVGTTAATGTIIFEATVDGKNWFTHSGVVDPNIGGTDMLVQSAITATAGSYYKIPVTGYKGFRIRVATTLANAIVLYFVGDTHDLFHDVTPAPHNLGYMLVHKDGEYTTTQTGVTLWAPTSGKKFCITNLTISTGGTTAGLVTVWQGATADTTYTAGTDPAIFRGNFIPSANATPGVVKSYPVPFVASTVDHALKVTTSAAMTIYIQVDGYEI